MLCPVRDFENYLKAAVGGIRDSKKREDVRAELLSHLEDVADYYVERGYSEDDACEKALAEMGDANDIGKKFGAIHNYFPALDLKNALTLLWCGILLNFTYAVFQGFAPGISFILSVAAQILIIIALLKMRKCGRHFKVAFVLELIACVIGCGISVYSSLPAFSSVNVNYLTLILLASSVPHIAAMGYCFFGIAEMLPPKGKPASMERCALFYVAALPLSFLTSLFGSILLSLAVLAFPIYILITLHNAKNFIWANGRDGGIEKIGKGIVAAVIAFILLLNAIPIASSLLVTAYEPALSEYVRRDSDTNVTAVFNELTELGMPDDILRDMRYSDVLRLQNADSLDCERYTSDGGEYELVICSLQMDDDKVINVIHYRYNGDVGFTHAEQLHIINTQYNMLFCITNAGDIVSLYDYGGKTYFTSNKTYSASNKNSLQTAAYSEFKLLKDADNQRGYVITENACSEASFSVIVDFYHQCREYRGSYGAADFVSYSQGLDDHGHVSSGITQSGNWQYDCFVFNLFY